jgi:hypothetical protein
MIKAIRSLICWLPLLTFICLNPASGEASSLSEDLYSFQVLIGGESIAIPCTYERMIEAGWTYTGNEDELLKPEQRTVSSAWEKNGVLLSAGMVNTSWDVLPVKQCVLAAVQLDDTAPHVVLPGGILLGSSGLREVMDAYGAPSSIYEDGEISRFTYQLDYDQEAVFTFAAYDGVLTSAALRNVVMAAAPDPTVLLGSSASGSSSYRTPSSLGDDPFDFHISYGDALYALPAPVKVFEKNGWVLGEGADNVVKAYGSGQLTLTYNGKQWTTWVYNDSDKATLAGSCLITTVVSDMGRGDVSIVLPGGVTNGMAEEEMRSAYEGIDAKISETDASRRYEFSRSGGEIILSLQLDTGLISRVEVKKAP